MIGRAVQALLRLPLWMRVVFSLCVGASVSALLIVASLMILYDRGIIAFNHPDPRRFPVRGIDVSHHQGRIDWKAVRSSSIDFAFIKATEGGDFVDPMFQNNWRESRSVGVIRGAYHFFTLCRSAEDQARNITRTVPRERGMLPPALDLEFGGNCVQRPSDEEVRLRIRTLSDLLHRHYAARPILYTTGEFFERYGEPWWTEHLWMRDIFFQPDVPFLFWQHNSRGRIHGIAGNVDLNVFRWGPLELGAMTIQD